MDISWIKIDNDEYQEYDVSELFDLIKEKSNNIQNAVQELEQLLKEIEN